MSDSDKKQVLLVHGGDTFRTYEEYLEFLKGYKIDLEKLRNGNWKEALRNDLGDGYEVILPQMPGKYNAHYEEWKIWLENFFPYFREGMILVGSSLGSAFLAKYLSENDFPVKISQIHLVAAPYDDNSKEYLENFSVPEDLSNLRRQVEKIFLYHSKDDPVVSFSEADKYRSKLPDSELVVFEDKGHMNKEKCIPELIERIKNG